jgi:anti-anti-sigma factor
MHADPTLRPPAGTITIEVEAPERRVLCLRGDVDTAVATRFASAQRRDKVVVDAIDAGAVTFISSSALALMVMCAEASITAGRHPVLRAASHQVDRALQLAGLESLFPRPEPGSGSRPPAGTRAEEAPPESR